MKQTILRDCISISIANLARHPRYKINTRYYHFTFIIQDRKIIDWGMNGFTGELDSLGRNYRQKIHSETVAWKRARGLLNKKKSFSAVNIRLNRCGDLRNSCPCSYCDRFLRLVGCREVWFSTEDGMARLSFS